jgi:DNA-binding transcriptional MocR family regulator
MNAPHTPGLGVPPLSHRAQSLGTENAFVVLAEVNALVREGRDIVSFCIGQPDFPTPANVQQAAISAIRSGKHGYTPSAGIDELRIAAARDMGALRGLAIEPEDVVVGAGAKPFIAYTIASAFRSTSRRSSRTAPCRCRSSCASRAASHSIRPSSKRRSGRRRDF